MKCKAKLDVCKVSLATVNENTGLPPLWECRIEWVSTVSATVGGAEAAEWTSSISEWERADFDCEVESWGDKRKLAGNLIPSDETIVALHRCLSLGSTWIKLPRYPSYLPPEQEQLSVHLISALNSLKMVGSYTQDLPGRISYTAK